VTRSKVGDRCLREQEAYGACKKFWTPVQPPNSCQFEILRPDLLFYLSLSLSLALKDLVHVCTLLMASSLIYVGEKKDWIGHHSRLRVFKRGKN